MTEDRFGANDIRQNVLTAWSASPARFREDANAEEDLVLGGYRDRLVVELAQNAADAAVRAGRPGRLLLALRESEGHGVLVAANTGAGLDAAGVQALATLRASAKRDGDTIGRFGVGFAAVLAISDEPAVLSRSGGVRFSAADTRQLVESSGSSASGASGSVGSVVGGSVAGGSNSGGSVLGGSVSGGSVSGETRSGDLAVELVRRDGHVPVLRLPFPAEGTPPEGYDTVVLLPLRDAAAEDLVQRLLVDVDDALLLALPALTEIVIERPGRPTMVLRDVAERWHVLRREGRLSPAGLTGRPTEERGRDRWQLTWALPHNPVDLPEPGVVHAPTPSDEPLPWPALLIATLPLDPSRRHVAPGPVTDEVLAAAATAYVELLVERAAAGDEVWPLVVGGLAIGSLDGALRAAVAELLPSAPILRSAEDPAMLLRPREALALAGPVGADVPTVTVFSRWLAGLVHAPRTATAAFDRLGVRRLSLADAVETLPPVADPVRWHEVYAALAPLAGDAAVREALAFLPVPLADGTVARGIRGLLLAAPESPESPESPGAIGAAGPQDSAAEITAAEVTAALVVLGARVVHPNAVHPLLERLGAVVAGPRALLELPAVAAAVASLADGDSERGVGPAGLEGPGEQQLVDAVLTLAGAAVRAGQLGPGDRPELGDLPLSDDGGELTPASALALPGSPAAEWFSADEIGLAAAELVERWGEPTLAAVGVLRGPGLVRAQDVPIDAGFDDELGPVADLDGWDTWCALVADELDGLPPGAVLAELVAVRDLDAVRPEALPDLVAAIAADPALRPALVGPARIIADGRPLDVPPYTAWWLRAELAPDGGPAGALAGPDAEPGLLALFEPAPPWVTRLDPVAQRALGVISTMADLDAAAVPGLLERLSDDRLEVSAELLVEVLSRLAVLARRGVEVDRPERVRGLDDEGGSMVVPAAEAVVIEAPMYRQRPDLGVSLPVSPAGAAALADLLDLPLAGELAPGEVAEAAGPEAGASQPTPAALRRLLPDGPATWCEHDRLLVDGVEVDWWVNGAGPGAVVHAATTDGLARGLAWAAGRWELRGSVAAVLAEPEIGTDVVIDQAFSDLPAETIRPAAADR